MARRKGYNSGQIKKIGESAIAGLNEGINAEADEKVVLEVKGKLERIKIYWTRHRGAGAMNRWWE